MARLLLVAALAGVWLLPAGARAERVGVVVAAQVNTRGDEARELAAALGRALRARLAVDVVAGDEAARRLPPGGVPDTCVADTGCQRDVARRLDADQLLLLAVVRVGTRVQVDATWVDVARGRTASRPRILVEDGGSPAAAVFTMAASVLLPEAAPRAPRAPRGSRDAAGPDATSAGPVAPAPARTGRRLTTGTWIAASAGAAALVAGGVIGVDALRRHRALDDRGCARVACPDGDIDAVDTRAMIADALLGAGVIAAVTAALLYWSSDEPGPERSMTSGPGLGIDLGGAGRGVAITWGGRF